MLLQTAIFVDAGYLFAAGSQLVTGHRLPRYDIRFDPAAAIDFLSELARDVAPEARLLRIYWYDGLVRRGQPTSDQATLGRMDNVKLRFGFVNSLGQQKGVDGLIISDIGELARNGAMSDAVILAGDEDIRVALLQAQTLGVRVHVVGIEPIETNQSPDLLADADTSHRLGAEQVRRFLRGPEMPFEDGDEGAEVDDSDFEAALAAEATAIPERVAALPRADEAIAYSRKFAGRMSSALDGQVMRSLSARVGRMLSENEKARFRQRLSERVAALALYDGAEDRGKAAAEHGLTPAEYARIEAALGRAPNMLELGIFSVMWSEHCSYKSSRIHLAKLPTTAPWVIQGPGENAGVIDIGDGWAAIFKMESHNHPSFIEPYQGAATGVGGIMRDVFTMGARPVALLNALSFGDRDAPRMKHLIAGVVSGIGGYGNCVGVPTVGGETRFEAGYNGNILVNAMCVGVARADAIFYSAAAGVGNPVVYVGSKTGRDGIHGAMMASAEFSADTEEKRPTVQVGDPFTEKLLIEACLELMATGAIVAIQDMGAAGLTSSSVEMASKGGVGIELAMDAVPCREEGMTPYEMMLSESQERMLMVLEPGREGEAEAIFHKWELDFAVIGRVTETQRLVLTWHGETVADLPLGPIVDDAPKYDRPWVDTPAPGPLGDLPESTDIGADLLALMGSPALASRRWIWEQYDHMVGADTVQRPGGDAAVVRVHGTMKALAMTCDVTPRYVAADPYEGGKQAVAEAYRNLIAVGAKPLAITDCLNFGSPENPVVMGQFVRAIEGMAEACRALDFPVVSGNVSLYNDTEGRPIPPTPSVGAVGLIDDWRRTVSCGFKAPGEEIHLVGDLEGGHLGRSVWLSECHGRDAGAPPPVDLEVERRHGAFVREAIAAGLLSAVHDVSDGGLLVAVTEMALAGGAGAVLDVGGGAAFWFGEDQARYVVTTRPAETGRLLALAAERGVRLGRVGTTGSDSVSIGGEARVLLARLWVAHEEWLPARMA